MDPLITNTEFLVRFDWRWVAKNVLDGPTASTSTNPPTLAQLQDPLTPAGSVLAELISEASELLMGACAVAKRYTEAEIRRRPLDTPPYPGGGSLMVRIVSDLTMGLILKRRARAEADEESLSKSYEEALGYLESLRRGERIFWQVPLVPEAGLPTTGSMQPCCPTLSQVAGRYFGWPIGGPVFTCGSCGSRSGCGCGVAGFG